MVVSRKILINSPIKDVRYLLNKESNLQLFHPFCKKNNVIKWSSNNYVDQIEYLNNKLFTRKFYEYYKNGYKLKIYSKDNLLANIHWHIEEDGTNTSLSIDAFPIIKFSKIINFIVWNFYFKYVLGHYLMCVIKGAKYHLETGNIVKPNQFGKNHWFS